MTEATSTLKTLTSIRLQSTTALITQVFRTQTAESEDEKMTVIIIITVTATVVVIAGVAVLVWGLRRYFLKRNVFMRHLGKASKRVKNNKKLENSKRENNKRREVRVTPESLVGPPTRDKSPNKSRFC